MQDSMSHIQIVGSRLETGNKDGSTGMEDVKVHPPDPPSEHMPPKTNTMLMDVSPTGTDGNKEALDK